MIRYPSSSPVLAAHACVPRWRLTRMGIAGIVFAAVSGAIPFPLWGQTRFHWPSEDFAIDAYPTYENCVAFSSRLLFMTYKNIPESDTIGYREFNSTYSLPSRVAAELKKCLSRFTSDDIPLNATYVGMNLFLNAQDDSAVKRILDRRIAAIPSENVAHIAAVIDSAILLYVTSRPARLAAGIAAYDRLIALGDRVPARSRIQSLWQLASVAYTMSDDVAHAALFTRYTKVAQSLTPEEWNSDIGAAASLFFKHMVETGGLDKAVEHLAISTDAYIKYLNGQFEEQLGRADASTDVNPQLRPGRRLSKVLGEYWFPTSAAQESYPRAGRVTLMVYVEHHERRGGTTGAALTGPAMLRRLVTKFPDMDVVLLSQTRGFIGNVEPPSPEKEAALIDSLFRVEYAMPGVLAVSRTPFWKLPDFDGRRIDEESDREQAGYQKTDQMFSMVVDKEGKLVYATGLTGFAEKWLETVIPVLVQRPFKPSKE